MKVVVPARVNGCRWRQLSRQVVTDHWMGFGVTLVFADDGGEVFSRGGSINSAVRHLPDNEIVVAADADILADFDAVEQAIEMARDGGLVQPFDRVQYLDESWTRIEWDFEATTATPLFGGLNVFSVDTWRQAGGFLRQFRGWGCEDVAFAYQCAVMVAPTRRVEATVTHLWHPKTGEFAAANNGDVLADVVAATTREELQEVLNVLSA